MIQEQIKDILSSVDKLTGVDGSAGVSFSKVNPRDDFIYPAHLSFLF